VVQLDRDYFKFKIRINLPLELAGSFVSNIAEDCYQILRGKKPPYFSDIFRQIRNSYANLRRKNFRVELHPIEVCPISDEVEIRLSSFYLDASIGMPLKVTIIPKRVYIHLTVEPSLPYIPPRAEDMNVEDLDMQIEFRGTSQLLFDEFERGHNFLTICGARGIGKTFDVLKASRRIVRKTYDGIPLIVNCPDDCKILGFEKYATRLELGDRLKILEKVKGERFIDKIDSLKGKGRCFVVLNDIHYLFDKVFDGSWDLRKVCEILSASKEIDGTRVIVMDQAPLWYVYKFENYSYGARFKHLMKRFGILTATEEAALIKEGKWGELYDTGKKVIWVEPPSSIEIGRYLEAYKVNFNLTIPYATRHLHERIIAHRKGIAEKTELVWLIKACEKKITTEDAYINSWRRVVNLVNLIERKRKGLGNVNLTTKDYVEMLIPFLDEEKEYLVRKKLLEIENLSAQIKELDGKPLEGNEKLLRKLLSKLRKAWDDIFYELALTLDTI